MTSECRKRYRQTLRRWEFMAGLCKLAPGIKPDLEGASATAELGRTVLVPPSLGTPPGCGWQPRRLSQHGCAHGCGRRAPV